MSYKLEQVNGCTKKFLFNFETLDLTSEIKTALMAKQRASNLKGFRKGKAPLAMVEKLFGPQIETDALNSFIQNRFFEAVDKEKVRVVGYPTFENLKYDAGKSVKFDAVVETFPEVEVKDLSKYSFTKEKAEVTDKDVDQLMNNYLGSKAEMIEAAAGTAVAKGLFAVINFQGEKENGERPENMKGEEYVLEVGTNTFIPGFEDGVIGMKKGEKKSLKLSFPADYHHDELKGAKVTFEVEVLEVKEKRLPEFTDELAKEFGFESVADFKTKNTENLKKQKQRQVEQKLHQDILEKLVADHAFDVPLSLVVQQESHLKEEVTRTLSSQGFNQQMMEDYFVKWKGDMTEKAKFQVRSGLILDALAKKFNIETGPKDLDVKMEEMAKESGIPVDQIKKYYSTNDTIQKNMLYSIREEKTFSAIAEKVKISEK